MANNNWSFRGDYAPRQQQTFNRNAQYKPIRKKSGAKSRSYVNSEKETKYLTTGWRLVNGALISIKAITTHKSKESDKGWFGSVAVTFTNTKTGEMHFHWGMMEKGTGKVVVNHLNFVMSPRSPNGGYAGTRFSKNMNRFKRY